ncbi:MAG: phage portal protein [Anaerococcus sp.]|nr:phage portal protein [Anaerococcus sp.]
MVASRKSDLYKGISYKFTRNAPKNVLEEASVVNSLNGLVSHETLLSYLSFVDNARDELVRLKDEDRFEDGLGYGHQDKWDFSDLDEV